MKSDTERKLYYNAPLHVLRNHMHVHLSKELRTSLGKRSALLKTGDTIVVMRGNHKSKQGKIARLNYTRHAVYVEGVTIRNAKGEEVLKAIQPSNLMITKVSESRAPKSKEVHLKKKKSYDKDKGKVSETKNETKKLEPEKNVESKNVESKTKDVKKEGMKKEGDTGKKL